jgi:hypothetical protein
MALVYEQVLVLLEYTLSDKTNSGKTENRDLRDNIDAPLGDAMETSASRINRYFH